MMPTLLTLPTYYLQNPDEKQDNVEGVRGISSKDKLRGRATHPVGLGVVTGRGGEHFYWNEAANFGYREGKSRILRPAGGDCGGREHKRVNTHRASEKKTGRELVFV